MYKKYSKDVKYERKREKARQEINKMMYRSLTSAESSAIEEFMKNKK